ncbi:Lipoprotein signal peptidase [Verrucomicrobia bacterium]|nr:Lipoprotein signal peptidase [Verrucomicrobiota bacterium]
MTPSRTVRIAALCVVLACTAGCDQATKHLARTGLSGLVTARFPCRLVELTLAENPGAFLSFGASLSAGVRNALTIGVGAGLAFLLVFLVRTPQLGRLGFLGLALTWAGGMSNLIDRFARHGLVTDFVVVRLGPIHTGIFNLADLAIVVGVLIFAASVLVAHFEARGNRPTNEP